MTDLELYEEMVRLTRSGEPFAMATVVASSGSSPRKAGAKMLVLDNGRTMGTVGGGRIEQETIAAAMTTLADGETHNLEFALTEEYGYACGGRMSLFIEPLGRNPLLVMFGAGHVGRSVTALAHACGFRVTVIDDRPDWADPALLPGARQVICACVADSFKKLQLDKESFVVIATPGHAHDFEAVRGCLATEAGFIGLLGSRRKRETLLKSLEDEGFDASQRDRVFTPVGLDIGAQTPEEISVSIMGQLIAIRRGKWVTT